MTQMTNRTEVAGSTSNFVPADWNPLVDATWWAKEVAAMQQRLSAAFPQFGSTTIESAIELATTRVAAGARIPNFLPVLVARDAKAWLTDQAANDAIGAA